MPIVQVHGALALAQTHAASKLKPEMAKPAGRPDKVRSQGSAAPSDPPPGAEPSAPVSRGTAGYSFLHFMNSLALDVQENRARLIHHEDPDRAMPPNY